MKEFCLLLYNVLVFAAAADIRPKSVNVAFETILEFDQAKHSAEVGLIDKIQNFLSNVKYALRSGRRTFSHLHKRDQQSIEVYVREAILVVLEYPDDDLEQLLRVVKTEVKGYMESGRKFNSQESFGNEGRPVPAKNIRVFLNSALEKVQEDRLKPSHRVMIEYMNMLMTDESKNNMKSLIDNLKMYGKKTKRGNRDLIPIVRSGLRSLYEHYYMNLDSNAKTTFKKIWSKVFNELLRTYNVDLELNTKSPEVKKKRKHRQKKKKHLREPHHAKFDFVGGYDGELYKDINNKAVYDRKKSSVESDKESLSSEISHQIIKTTRSKAPKKKRVRMKITTPKTYMHTLWEEEINVAIENKIHGKLKSSEDSEEPDTYSNKRFKIQKSKKKSKKRNPTKESINKKKPKRHNEKRKEKKKHRDNTKGANKKLSFWYSKNRRSNNFEGLAIESLEGSRERQSKRRVSGNYSNHSHVTNASSNNCNMSGEVETFPGLNENCSSRSQRNKNCKMDTAHILSESKGNITNCTKITARKTAELSPHKLLESVNINDVDETTTTDIYSIESDKNDINKATVDNHTTIETNKIESTSYTSSTIIINVGKDTNVNKTSNKSDRNMTYILNETSLPNDAATTALLSKVSTDNLAKLQAANINDNNIK